MPNLNHRLVSALFAVFISLLPNVSYATCVSPNACSAPAGNNTRNCTSYTGPTCYDDSGYSYYSCTGCSSGYSLEYTSVCGHSLGYCSRDSSPDPDPDPDPGVCERPSSCESYSTSYGSYSYNSIASWNQSTCTCSWSYSYTCNSGYYGSGTSCSSCPSSHPYGGGNGTSISSCYKSCSRACTPQSCPANSTSCVNDNSTSSGRIYYGTSTCTAPETACKFTSITCAENYCKSGDSCVLCECGEAPPYVYYGLGPCASISNACFGGYRVLSCASCMDGWMMGCWGGPIGAPQQRPISINGQSVIVRYCQPIGSFGQNCSNCNTQTIDQGAHTMTVNVSPAINGTTTYCRVNSISYSCNSGYYGSGRSCTKCPASHPSGGGDGTTISNCYKSCSRACTKPACPAGANCSYGNEYTYGTEYYGGSCNAAASTCSLTVTSCNSGYYKDGNSCVLCPESYPNSASGATSQSGCYTTCSTQSITGGNRVPVSGTVYYGNNCEYTTVCNDGYNQSSDGVCSQLCGLGFTTLRTGTGLVIPLYSEKLSSPAIHIGLSGGMCYGILKSGSGNGINLEYGGQTYHTGA